MRKQEIEKFAVTKVCVHTKPSHKSFHIRIVSPDFELPDEHTEVKSGTRNANKQLAGWKLM
jgi:hypothetical protein